MISLTSKIICNVSKRKFCRFLPQGCFPQPIEPIVTLLDAASGVGSNLAFLLKQNPLIKELRLYDEEKNTCGLALSLDDLDTRTAVRSYSCKSLKGAIQGAHLVISTGGCPCKPSQNQKHLFAQNLDNVRNAATFLAEFNPAAIYCIAKPPVEALVPMVVEEFKRAEVYDPRKIIGVTTATSMVANTLIANHLNKDPSQILCPVIGGVGPKTVIPVVSQTKPSVNFDPRSYTDLQEGIAKAEEKLLEQGTMSCYSKSVGISRFINLVVRALRGDTHCVECAFVAQTGHIEEFLPFMSSIVRLGPQGVISTHMPKVNDIEATSLRAAIPHITESIHLGRTFLYGDFEQPVQFKTRKVCDELLKRKIEECGM